MEDLEKDTAFLASELPKLATDVGKYVLVFKQKVVGTFESYELAISHGYEVAGLKPFLVQQISAIPQTQQFTRVVGFECLTLA